MSGDVRRWIMMMLIMMMTTNYDEWWMMNNDDDEWWMMTMMMFEPVTERERQVLKTPFSIATAPHYVLPVCCHSMPSEVLPRETKAASATSNTNICSKRRLHDESLLIMMNDDVDDGDGDYDDDDDEWCMMNVDD